MVDAAGLRCPLPVIRLAAAAQTADIGSVIAVTSTDPAAGPDIAAWCRMRGHELVEQFPVATRPDRLVSRVRVIGRPGAGAPGSPRGGGHGRPPD